MTLACTAGALTAGCTANPAREGEGPALQAASLLGEAAADANADRGVVVVLADAPAGSSVSGITSAAMHAARLASAQERVLAAVPSAQVLHRYRHLPFLHLRARKPSEAAALAAHPDVLRTQADVAYPKLLSHSLPFVRAPAALAQGHDGAGTTVAVLDEAADPAQPAFGSCLAAGAPGCKLAAALRFAPGSGVGEPREHGSNVAAIVLGVAPGARVASLDVFQNGSAHTGDLLAALDWVIEQRAALNIVALNLSLGAGEHTTPCADDALSVALAWARFEGILATVAAGNDGHTNALALPACAPSAISVGAVYDIEQGGLGYGSCQDGSTKADQVTCFSDSAPFLSLLAPGALITAGGSTMAGTSQAAPHVAGAIAVLRAAYPAESLAQIVARLRSGPSVTDPRNGLRLPRLDLAAATSAPEDTSRPLGHLAIDGGATSTRDPHVTLTLTAPGATEMCLSSGIVCLAWQPFAPTLPWSLESGSGLRTLNAWFRSSTGVTSALPASAAITLQSE